MEGRTCAWGARFTCDEFEVSCSSPRVWWSRTGEDARAYILAKSRLVFFLTVHSTSGLEERQPGQMFAGCGTDPEHK
jgi:hypothetical protein